LIDNGFLKDDGSGIWELIKMEIGFVAFASDTGGMSVLKEKGKKERFTSVGGPLKDKGVNFGEG
jgi:hypothetical protein